MKCADNKWGHEKKKRQTTMDTRAKYQQSGLFARKIEEGNKKKKPTVTH